MGAATSPGRPTCVRRDRMDGRIKSGHDVVGARGAYRGMPRRVGSIQNGQALGWPDVDGCRRVAELLPLPNRRCRAARDPRPCPRVLGRGDRDERPGNRLCHALSRPVPRRGGAGRRRDAGPPGGDPVARRGGQPGGAGGRGGAPFARPLHGPGDPGSRARIGRAAQADAARGLAGDGRRRAAGRRGAQPDRNLGAARQDALRTRTPVFPVAALFAC